MVIFSPHRIRFWPAAVARARRHLHLPHEPRPPALGPCLLALDATVYLLPYAPQHEDGGPRSVLG
jgi:hypothetical protein